VTKKAVATDEPGEPKKKARKKKEAADKMRGNLEAGEYKHVVLGLVFLKYVSDAFEEGRAWLEAATADPANSDYGSEGSELEALRERQICPYTEPEMAAPCSAFGN